MGIEINNVVKTFEINGSEILVLDDISISVREGEIISIVGKSGCGKSTLLKIIAGLESATQGDVELDGKPIKRPSEKDIGIIFQESRLFPWSTAEKNIEFGISTPLDKHAKKELVQEHIALVGLSGFEKALPKQLSGGMQQRVSIARSLINRPRVLLLDEPFGALDAFTKINMQQEVLRIWSKEKMTLILVTHDIDEAIFLGDRVMVMANNPGRIEKMIPIELSHPRDRASDDFDFYRKEVFKQFFKNEERQPEYTI